MWGTDTIARRNNSLYIQMGIENFLFDKEVSFNSIDKIYNPFPKYHAIVTVRNKLSED